MSEVPTTLTASLAPPPPDRAAPPRAAIELADITAIQTLLTSQVPSIGRIVSHKDVSGILEFEVTVTDDRLQVEAEVAFNQIAQVGDNGRIILKATVGGEQKTIYLTPVEDQATS
jgi:hypothetical protein